MDHYERIAAAQGIFDTEALLKVREAYLAAIKALAAQKILDQAQRAEIAEAIFHLAKLQPEMSSVELTIHIIDEFSRSFKEPNSND